MSESKTEPEEALIEGKEENQDNRDSSGIEPERDFEMANSASLAWCRERIFDSDKI